jgi:hypothetical protein
VDFEFLPLAAVGVAGVAIGRVLGRRRDEDRQRRSAVGATFEFAGRTAGLGAATALRAGGLAAQGVGLAAMTTAGVARSVAGMTERAVRSPGGDQAGSTNSAV